jgi:hypothetical protein
MVEPLVRLGVMMSPFAEKYFQSATLRYIRLAGAGRDVDARTIGSSLNNSLSLSLSLSL